MKNPVEFLQTSAASSHWKKIGIKKRAGVCTPLFSIRSEHSTGIGEFFDLLPLIEMCTATGMDVIQLLPINDTGDHPSPYSGISAFALHPIYLSLDRLKNNKKDKGLVSILEELKQEDSSSFVRYHKVLSLKMDFLKRYFSKKALWKSDENKFQAFCKRCSWLESYAAFCILKNKFQSKPWYDWPISYQKPRPSLISRIKKENRAEYHFVCFLQFLCFEQMIHVKKQAEKKGILLKGDIPILVSKDSADVWAHQNLFFHDLVAGAPPDQFNTKGQNWNFPIYNWKQMEKTQYAWWCQRMQTAQLFYDLYRIDHAVGFFRIWSIGKSGDPKKGQFLPKDPSTWIAEGQKHLKMLLDCTTMLPVAEDLGKVSSEIREAIMELGICGTRVVKNQSHWRKKHFVFTPKDYPVISMTTLGTHDMDPIAIWWKTYPKMAKRYCAYFGWKYDKEFTKKQQIKFLRFSAQTASLLHINMLDEYLCLNPQYTHYPDEKRRVNLPGTILETNWSFRMQGTLEDVIQDTKLLKEIISCVG